MTTLHIRRKNQKTAWFGTVGHFCSVRKVLTHAALLKAISAKHMMQENKISRLKTGSFISRFIQFKHQHLVLENRIQRVHYKKELFVILHWICKNDKGVTPLKSILKRLVHAKMFRKWTKHVGCFQMGLWWQALILFCSTLHFVDCIPSAVLQTKYMNSYRLARSTRARVQQLLMRYVSCQRSLHMLYFYSSS